MRVRSVIAVVAAAVILAGCSSPTPPSDDDEPYATFSEGFFSAEASPEWVVGEVPDDLIPPDSLSAAAHGWEWSMTAPGGYSALGQFEVGDVSPVGTVHPDVIYVCSDGSTDCDAASRSAVEFVAGEICGANPDTDAVVPVSFRLEATTAEFVTSVAGGLTVSLNRGEGDYLGLSRVLTVELKSSTWTDCDDSSDGSATISMESVEPLEEGSAVKVSVFVIIPNYFSPSHPSGDPTLLSLIELSPRMSQFGDAGFWAYVPGSTEYKDHSADRVPAEDPPYLLSGQ